MRNLVHLSLILTITTAILVWAFGFAGLRFIGPLVIGWLIVLLIVFFIIDLWIK